MTKIADKIKKLLALAASGSGATEAEASSAAAKAAEIMEEHGLTMMAVEMAGGIGEGRGRDGVKVDAPAWYAGIMAALAETYFCEVELVKVAKREFEFRLLGRLSSVTAAKVTFEYLSQAIWRLSRQERDGSPHYFRCGCAERISERLRQRHADRLKEQQAEAAKANQRPSNGQGGALVVTLVDYGQRERDLNADFRNGLTPGTTEEKRRLAAEANARNEARHRELVASGIPDGVAWNMVFLGQSRERAEEYEREYLKIHEKARRRQSKWTGRDERAWQNHQRKEAKKSHPSWSKGRQVGDDVSLDQQIDNQQQRRIR